jgi:preprotein translocase subunit SecE
MSKDNTKKTLPIDFIRQVKAETKKVTWPTRQETTISTIMVFIMVTLAAIFLFLTDQVVSMLIRWLLG